MQRYRSIQFLGIDQIPRKNATQWEGQDDDDGAVGSLSRTIEQLYNKLESSWDVQEQTDRVPVEAFARDLKLLRAKIEEQERSLLKNRQE